jgi:hypothetical protein
MSDKMKSSEQFCRILFSLSFETSRTSNGLSGAEKFKKYGANRIFPKNMRLREDFFSV